MAQRLKRWESPRRQGRNDKGRGGSARSRQKQKQLKLLRQKLKEDGSSDQTQSKDKKHQKGGEIYPSFLYLASNSHYENFLGFQVTGGDLKPKHLFQNENCCFLAEQISNPDYLPYNQTVFIGQIVPNRIPNYPFN